MWFKRFIISLVLITVRLSVFEEKKFIFSEIHRPLNCSLWDILLCLKLTLFWLRVCAHQQFESSGYPGFRRSSVLCVHNWLHSITSPHYAFGIEVYTVKGAVDNLCVYIQIIYLKEGCLYSSLKFVPLWRQIALVRWRIKIKKSVGIALKGQDLCI
jgi:hypothetical protein